MNIIEKFNEKQNVFQKEVVLYAKENKEEVKDILLNHLEEFILGMNKESNPPISVVYAIYLLAEFEDKRLFPLLIKLFGIENLDYCDYIGDWILDDLTSVIVSVFDNDFEALNSIIENKEIDPYTRGEFLRCYRYFCDNKIISKEELRDYLLKLIEVYNNEEDDIYVYIVEVVIYAKIFDLIKEMKKLYARDLIDPIVRGGYDRFIDDIFDYEMVSVISKIDDTIKKMSWWAWFENERREKQILENYEQKTKKFIADTKESCTTNKVGRNDPCPCGSGKKYKKCCIDNDSNVLPYQNYINASLANYPKKKDSTEKVDIYDIYKEEYIEIDKLLYKVLFHKKIPLFIERDMLRESKQNLEFLREAYEKIKEEIVKNNFKKIIEFDEEIGIRYSLYSFFSVYSEILIYLYDNDFKKEKYLEELKEIIDYFYDNFDLIDDYEGLFINRIHQYYSLANKLSEGEEYYKERLNNCTFKAKYDIYVSLFDIYSCQGENEKINDLIKNETNKELKEKLEGAKYKFIDGEY